MQGRVGQYSAAHLYLVIEALVEQSDAEPQVFAVLLLLPEQLSLAVVAQLRAPFPQTVLHPATMGIHPTTYRFGIILHKPQHPSSSSHRQTQVTS